MMLARLLLLATVASFSSIMVPGSTMAATGVSITNRDDKEHKLTVIEDDGAKKTDHVLKASQVLEGICGKGCVIRLNDSEEDEYELEGAEVVSIEEGYLYYDGPETPADTPPTTSPPAKK